jgi:DNA-binding ferritin-like protein
MLDSVTPPIAPTPVDSSEHTSNGGDVDVSRCLDECTSELFQGSPWGPLAVYLAASEALTAIHLSHHWQVSGITFYADHELFKRLYESAGADVDPVAEKLVGLSGEPALTNYFKRLEVMKKFMTNCTSREPYVNVSLNAELMYIKLGEAVVAKLKEAGCLSDGLENMLQGILDKHEGLVYLLRQRVGDAS